MSIKRAACLVILLMLSAGTSQAQEPEVARNTCSECHATQKGQLLSPNLRAPTWVEIANTPGVTEAALLVMLNDASCRNADVRIKPRTKTTDY